MSKTKLALIAAAGILLASQISFAASVVVGSCKKGLAPFTTIQDAITQGPAAPSLYAPAFTPNRWISASP